MSEKIRGFIDRLLSKAISKKLLVFLICSTGFFMGKIASPEWIKIAMIYIGTQGTIDAVKTYIQK